MKKILYTINFLTNGGPTRVLQNIIKNLDKNKYDIYVMTLIDENSKDIVQALKERGVKVIEFKYSKSLREILKNRKKIIKEINEIGADIIHTHGIVSTLVVSSNKVKGKKLTTIHNNMYEDYRFTYGKIKGVIFAKVHIFCLKKFDEIICCSKTSYDLLKKEIKNISYVRNGVDITKESQEEIRNKIRKSLNINDNDIVYIYVGVINNRKRVVELVDMFSKSMKENEYLLIVGDGPLTSKAKTIASDKVIFTGFKESTIDYFLAADIYTSYSSSEGFSISIIEALGCGLLCLVSDINSHKECFIINNKCYIGEYFNSNNFEIKKQKVRDMIKKSSKKEIEDFQREFLSSKSMTDEYIEHYEKWVI